MALGGSLSGRRDRWPNQQTRVLVSRSHSAASSGPGRRFHLALTKGKVADSPSVDADKPVSRQHEREHSAYYGYRHYWGASGRWGVGTRPSLLVDGPGNDPPAEQPENPGTFICAAPRSFLDITSRGATRRSAMWRLPRRRTFPFAPTHAMAQCGETRTLFCRPPVAGVDHQILGTDQVSRSTRKSSTCRSPRRSPGCDIQEAPWRCANDVPGFLRLLRRRVVPGAVTSRLGGCPTPQRPEAPQSGDIRSRQSAPARAVRETGLSASTLGLSATLALRQR